MNEREKADVKCYVNESIMNTYFFFFIARIDRVCWGGGDEGGGDNKRKCAVFINMLS